MNTTFEKIGRITVQFFSDLMEQINCQPASQPDMARSQSSTNTNMKDAIREAILYVQHLTDNKGRYLFTQKNQWFGIYRILVDKKIVKNQAYRDFGMFIDNLQIGELRVNLNARELSKCNKGTLSNKFEAWDLSQATSSIQFEKLHKIAVEFKTKLEELLPE